MKMNIKQYNIQKFKIIGKRRVMEEEDTYVFFLIGENPPTVGEGYWYDDRLVVYTDFETAADFEVNQDVLCKIVVDEDGNEYIDAMKVA